SSERWIANWVPPQVHMALVANRTNVLRRGHCTGSVIWIGIDPELIHDKRVLFAVGSGLVVEHILQILRAKLIDISRAKFTQRDTHLNPARGGEIPDDLSHSQRFRERSGKLRYLQSLPRSRKQDGWQICGRNSLRGETPEIEIAPREFRISIAKIHHPNFGFPYPSFSDRHCRRSAFGGVRNIFVSTGRCELDCSIKL